MKSNSGFQQEFRLHKEIFMTEGMVARHVVFREEVLQDMAKSAHIGGMHKIPVLNNGQ
jgi:hypothetical protein